jgi:hypothetical protein
MNLTPEDATLRAVLRTHHRTAPASNPNFRAAVWARIEAGRAVPTTWAAWVRLHLTGFALAAAASVTMAAAAGGWAATVRAERARDVMVTRYVASIDPHRQVTAADRGER